MDFPPLFLFGENVKVLVTNIGADYALQEFIDSYSAGEFELVQMPDKRAANSEYLDMSPDVIVLFCDNGGTPVIDVCKFKSDHCANTPIIIIDIKFNAAAREIYLAAGACEYLDYQALDINILFLAIRIAGRTFQFTKNAYTEATKFKLLCDTLKVGSWDWDLRKNTYAWSPREYELFGIDNASQEISYESWRDAIHTEDQERVEAELGRAMVGQSAYHSVFRVRRHGGALSDSVRWIEGVGQVQRDEHGAALSMFGLNWDVTAKHNALADLEAIRNCSSCLSHNTINPFQTYFEQSVDCLFNVVEAADGRLLYTAMNSCGVQHVGVPLHRILGRTPTDVLGDDVGREIESGMRAAIKTKKPFYYKPTFDMGGGSVVYDAVYIPISNEKDVIVGVLGCARDITAERQMAMSLFNAQKMEALANVTGGTAHDFNNILQTISGALEIIEKIRTPEKTQVALNMCRSAVTVGKALTSSMLAFARREELTIRSGNVNQLVVAIAEMTRLTIGPAIRLNIDTETALWPALISEQQIEMAIINLAANARDAMPSGGSLTISTRNFSSTTSVHGLPAGDYICLAVTDTGTGMSSEVLAKAAEPLYTTKPIGKGTGLGLSMVNTTVENMGGAVQITSELSRGTCVRMYLKRAIAELKADELP